MGSSCGCPEEILKLVVFFFLIRPSRYVFSYSETYSHFLYKTHAQTNWSWIKKTIGLDYGCFLTGCLSSQGETHNVSGTTKSSTDQTLWLKQCIYAVAGYKETRNFCFVYLYFFFYPIWLSKRHLTVEIRDWRFHFVYRTNTPRAQMLTGNWADVDKTVYRKIRRDS